MVDASDHVSARLSSGLIQEARKLDRKITIVAFLLALMIIIGPLFHETMTILMAESRATRLQSLHLLDGLRESATHKNNEWVVAETSVGGVFDAQRRYDRDRSGVSFYTLETQGGKIPVFVGGEKPLWPYLEHVRPVTILGGLPILLSGQPLKEVRVLRSVWPALFPLRFRFLTLFIVGVVTFFVARNLPLQVLRRTFQRLERAQEEAKNHIDELQKTKKELQTTARDLSDALEEAAAASQVKSQFLATMSHELRTPLNAVLGFSDVLKDQMFGPLGDERYREYAEHIHVSGTHLLDIINDILDLTRIDSSRMRLVEEDFDLISTLNKVNRVLRTQIELGKLTVTTDFPEVMPHIRGDAQRIRQVFLNIISNAIKFTPEFGQVSIRVSLEEDGVHIVVADTGIGISAEDIPKAFDLFGQIDSRLARRFNGIGVGLPLAKRLIELHQGTLKLESMVGLGTTVSVLIPAARIVSKDEEAA